MFFGWASRLRQYVPWSEERQGSALFPLNKGKLLSPRQRHFGRILIFSSLIIFVLSLVSLSLRNDSTFARIPTQQSSQAVCVYGAVLSKQQDGYNFNAPTELRTFSFWNTRVCPRNESALLDKWTCVFLKPPMGKRRCNSRCVLNFPILRNKEGLWISHFQNLPVYVFLYKWAECLL